MTRKNTTTNPKAKKATNPQPKRAIDDNFAAPKRKPKAEPTITLAEALAESGQTMDELKASAVEAMPKPERQPGTSNLATTIRNPYRSIVVRAVEIVHAFAEAIDLIDAYATIEPPCVDLAPRDAVGFGCSEAPRGACWHRYEVRADGTVAAAKIVPPTSQNQARIERDLIGLAPELLALPHAEATHRCEQLIRSYDPCISCATHFLRLDIQRTEAPACER